MNQPTNCPKTGGDAPHVVKPRFFPGQCLSDQDLTDLVAWVEKRLQLQPTCSSWGIACGLAVSVNPAEPAELRIGPGYGFDAAMNLCLLEKDARCPLPKATCAPCGDRASGDPVTLGPIDKIPVADLVIYDLKLSAAECGQSPALALANDGRRHCEVTRIRTVAALNLVPVDVNAEAGPSTSAKPPPTPELKFLQEFEDQFGANFDWKAAGPLPEKIAESIRVWLQRQADRCPQFIQPFPTLPSLWNAELSAPKLLEILSWMVFGLRRSNRDCPNHRDDCSIPLARLWIRCVGGKSTVLWIDDSARYRRVMRCCDHGFHLEDWIGESVEQAQCAAGHWGLTIAQGGWTTPADLNGLQTALKAEFDLSSALTPAKTIEAQCYPALLIGTLSQTEQTTQGNEKKDEQRVFAFVEKPAVQGNP